MEKTMGQLAGDFALRVFLDHGSTCRLQGMAEHLTERAVAGLIVNRDNAPQAAQRIAGHLARPERLIASDRASMAKLFEQAFSADMPGPFLELESQAVELVVEEPLRVGIGG